MKDSTNSANTYNSKVFPIEIGTNIQNVITPEFCNKNRKADTDFAKISDNSRIIKISENDPFFGEISK